jgi:hypothetical protein
VDDALDEGHETLVLTLQPGGSDYLLDADTTATATIEDDDLPPPAALAATVLSNTEVHLTWQDASLSEDGFAVFWRASASNASWDVLELPTGTTSYTLRQLDEGRTYDFLVSAFNTSDEEFSATVQAATLVDAAGNFILAPSGLNSSARVGAIDVMWQDNSNNELGFLVQRSVAGGPWEAIGHVLSNQTSFIDEIGIQPQTAHTYRVLAFGDGKESPFSGEASTLSSGGNGLPAPDLEMVQKVSGKVILGWNYDLAPGQTMTIYAGPILDFVPQSRHIIAQGLEGHLWVDDETNPSEATYYVAAVAVEGQGKSATSAVTGYQPAELYEPPADRYDLPGVVDNYVPDLEINPLPDDVLLVGFYGAGEYFNESTRDPEVWANEYIQMLAKQLGGTIRQDRNHEGLPYKWNHGDGALVDLANRIDVNNNDIISGREVERDVRVFGYSWGGVQAVDFTRQISKKNRFGGKRATSLVPALDNWGGFHRIEYEGGIQLRKPVPVKVLTTFDPVNTPFDFPVLDQVAQLINSTGDPRSNVERFINIYQSENNGYEPGIGEAEPSRIRKRQSADPQDPGNGTLLGGFLDGPWEEITVDNLGNYPNSAGSLRPSFTGNAFDPGALDLDNVVQIDVNTSDGFLDGNGNPLDDDNPFDGDEYAWQERIWVSSPFWMPGYGTNGEDKSHTQGGTFGRDANHSTIVPLAYWWLEQELRDRHPNYVNPV